MSLTAKQVGQLLMPINEARVLTDGKGHSHVSQQDVLAHLIRVFGFGNFDIDVLDAAMVFEDERADNNGVGTGRWDVCYRAMVRLTVRDPDGLVVAHYENGSTATAQNQKRGDGHDLAYKSAISLSVKRAAIALGDQFGLSLYNKGQLTMLVKGTLVHPDPDHEPDGDMQDGVERQVSLGNDEVDPDIEEPKPKQVKTSDRDQQEAARRGVTPEQERADRLAEQKVRRDALGVDSKGKTVKEEQGRVTRTQGRPTEPDPWAGRADPFTPDAEVAH